jgi:hypothetical protein
MNRIGAYVLSVSAWAAVTAVGSIGALALSGAGFNSGPVVIMAVAFTGLFLSPVAFAPAMSDSEAETESGTRERIRAEVIAELSGTPAHAVRPARDAYLARAEDYARNAAQVRAEYLAALARPSSFPSF